VGRTLWVSSALLGLLCAPLATASTDGGPHFQIRNARIFDGERLLPRASVEVEGGRITAVGPSLSAPSGTEVVDGEGRTLLPGLIDAHAHVRGSALREELVFGVTTALDMATDVAWAAARREEQGAGQGLDRADLFSAGDLITAPGGHGTEYAHLPSLSSPEAAKAAVDRRIAEGSDYIKIVFDDNRAFGRPIPTLSPETMRAAIEAAHARHRLAVVHIGSVAGARAALEAGADGLAHLSPDGVLDDDVVALAKRRGAFVVPTLSLNESLTGVASGASLVTDPHLAPFLSPFSAKNLTLSYALHPDHPLDFNAVLTSVARLHQAGVPILAGTDAPNRGTATGASLHRELELLVRAGLAPVDALAAATAAPARAFSLEDRGRIAVGRRADLVLVDGDPSIDIRATRNIVSVWKLGHRADRDAYRSEQQESRIAVPWIGIAMLIGLIATIWLLRRTARRRTQSL
jgi:imidazolonepropionase-like amidohydrolase